MKHFKKTFHVWRSGTRTLKCNLTPFGKLPPHLLKLTLTLMFPLAKVAIDAIIMIWILVLLILIS